MHVSEVYNEKQLAKFWSKVDRRGADECWPWTGRLAKGLYGVVYVGALRKTMYAHRMSRWIADGEYPSVVVRHTCDTPNCVNPAHLLNGTQRDNIKDAVLRGRTARGARSGRAKFTQEQADSIREEYRTTAITMQGLADKHGTSRITIGAIVRGDRY
jgi:hypothetical protein